MIIHKLTMNSSSVAIGLVLLLDSPLSDWALSSLKRLNGELLSSVVSRRCAMFAMFCSVSCIATVVDGGQGSAKG